MSDGFLRAFAAKPFEVISAHGSTLVTTDGKELLDVGGANHGVALLGHNHPAVMAAVHSFAGPLHVAHTVPEVTRTKFLAMLHELTGMDQTFLGNSGTEVVECALKLAAGTGRIKQVATKGSFHGRTLGAVSVTGQASYQKPYKHMLAEVQLIPFGDVEALQEIDEETSCFIVEPILGEGGVILPPDGYLRQAKERCEAVGALLIVDEIQTGLGRTGEFLACDHDGIRPDILLLAKGLAGGIPIGACCVTNEVAALLAPGGHGSTYGGSPFAAAAGIATLGVMRDEQLHVRAKQMGGAFKEMLANIPSPAIKEVRGRGLMIAVELRIRSGEILGALQASGILALPAGTRGIRFLPSLTIEEEQLRYIAAMLEKVLP